MWEKGSAAPTQYVIITSDAVSLQVNPLQCGYFRQLVGEDGEVVISQIDAGQMLHAGHSVWQFGENISLQIQFCEVIEGLTMWDLMRAVFTKDVLSRLISYLSARRRLKKIC